MSNFGAKPSGNQACVEVADGAPWVATASQPFTFTFTDALAVEAAACVVLDESENAKPLGSAELPSCTLHTAGGPVVLRENQAKCSPLSSRKSKDGRYLAVAVPSECGDYCYADVVLVDQKLGRRVRTERGVEVETRIEWAAQGSRILVGSKLLDAADAKFEKSLALTLAGWRRVLRQATLAASSAEGVSVSLHGGRETSRRSRSGGRYLQNR